MDRSYIVTGAGRGFGRAVVERLLSNAGSEAASGGFVSHVVAIDLDPEALAWTRGQPAGSPGDRPGRRRI
jgi:NAD(P)-dependent dehydrogenase (short-subunit alcohol dehydrogenase family)